MKHHIKDSFLKVTVKLLAFTRLYAIIYCCLICLLPSTSFAQSLSQIKSPDIGAGTLIEFVEGEYILADGLDAPKTGWKLSPNPNIYTTSNKDWRAGDYHTLLGRFYFEQDAVGVDPIAIYTVGMRNNFTIFINGNEVFRNFANSSDSKNSWYRPFLIGLPEGVLKPGTNEILIHAYSNETVGVGRIIMGSHSTLKEYYETKFFWQITAPMAASFALLLIGALAFLFWLGRRQEIELLWLSISTGLWFLRNHQYFSETIPFNIALYSTLPVYATFFASVASAAFYFYFIKLPHRKQIIFLMFLGGIPLIVIDVFLGTSDQLFYYATTVIILYVASLAFMELIRQSHVERRLLGFGMMMMPVPNFYDLIMAITYGGDGSKTYLSPFGGLFFTIFFLISFGKRTLDAFAYLGTSNLVLEHRIAETRAELAASEAERQDMIVGRALANERGRLMQEMHDGIGSNLITALAIARNQNQPEATIKTLNRAINDLKITVDSLEPVEGDLVVLIGNLRHRMAGDLRDAGIICKWEVQECKTLPWLDAANALHVLRVFQEAIGNALVHSGASEIRIGCKESYHEGIAGITSYVADNGSGFDLNAETQGKGVSNIHARARSLHGTSDCESRIGVGTVITLWLPYDRLIEKKV